MFGYGGYYGPPTKPPNDDIKNKKYSELTEEEIRAIRWQFIFQDPPVFGPVNRCDIVGVDHILEEVDVYIRLIQHFEELESKNAELDTGVIFTGAPGSGKTYCARYLATEAKARFIDISAFPRRSARFMAEDIIVLFGLLKQYVTDNDKPVIAFWDEFETFTDVGDNADKIEALARFKTELSGIKGKLRGIFIIVATNRPTLIPSDVSRPGRLGKNIKFSALTRSAKNILLKHFINQFEHTPDIDFESLSYLISADYPPDIEEAVKDAWRCSVMSSLGTANKPCLTVKGLIQVLIKQARGTPSDVTLTDEEMRAIAIYEIGRAFVTRTLKYSAQLIVLDRIGYGDAYRIAQNEHHSAHMLLKIICDQIAIRYGGILAQVLCGIESNSKQIHDFNHATVDAQHFVEQLRSAKLGTEYSLGSLAQSRTEQDLPPSVGVADNDMYNSKQAIMDLLKVQQERVMFILKHYGEEFIENAARQLIEKNYMLQVDIDDMLDKNFAVPDSPAEKTRNKAGFVR